MKVLFLILIICFVVVCSAQTSFACSCTLRTTPGTISAKEAREHEQRFILDEVEKADSVFSGEVLDLAFESPTGTELIGRYKVRMRVDRIWKGNGSKEITIFTADDCFRFKFSVGERYLVYANRSDGGDKLWTGICAGTAPLTLSNGKLKVIGKGRRPQKG